MSERTGTNRSEPPPVANASRPIWELVVEDVTARAQAGRAKYGVFLQAGNCRNALVDAYQECLDLCAYLRQAIAERGLPAPGEAGLGVGLLADHAPTASAVHAALSVGSDRPMLPSCDSRELPVDGCSTPLAHQGAQLANQHFDKLDPLGGPRPASLAPVTSGPVVDAAHLGDGQASSHDIFIRHAAYHGHERSRRAVFVLSIGEEEATLTFEEAGEPRKITLGHAPKYAKNSDLALDLAAYLRQRIEEDKAAEVATLPARCVVEAVDVAIAMAEAATGLESNAALALLPGQLRAIRTLAEAMPAATPTHVERCAVVGCDATTPIDDTYPPEGWRTLTAGRATVDERHALRWTATVCPNHTEEEIP